MEEFSQEGQIYRQVRKSRESKSRTTERNGKRNGREERDPKIVKVVNRKRNGEIMPEVWWSYLVAPSRKELNFEEEKE